MKKISIIIPCYNEEQSIPYFYKEIDKISKIIKANFEFIFVNDGSKDNTIGIIKKYSKKDKRVKYIHFSRNKNSLIIFDEKLNVIEEIKKSGEIYQLTFDKEDNLYVNLYDRRNCKIKFYRLSK